MLKYAVTKTISGYVAVLCSENGLVATTLPQKTEQHALMALGRDISGAITNTAGLESFIERIQDYFNRKRVDFNDVTDPDGTPFQRKVWEITKRILYGETNSYLWIARQMGRPRAARAVGQALGANPLPIVVPCHRVLTNTGGLGGFGGGLDMKRRLLTMERKNMESTRLPFNTIKQGGKTVLLKP